MNSLYLKINFPPYFFQLDLAHSVDAENSKCTIGNGVAVINLVKCEGRKWEDIRYKGLDVQDRRKRAEEEALELEKKKRENKLAAKRKEEKKLIQEQIDVERATRQRVESIKYAQKNEALVFFYITVAIIK